MMNRGFFISFEGPEGGGKSTQVRRLSNSLESEGYRVLTLREPDGTKLSGKIGSLLVDSTLTNMVPQCKALVFLAARNELMQVIIPAIEEGRIVIADRFRDSTLVYQEFGRGINFSTLSFINDCVTQGLVPNLTFLLDIDVELGLGRKLRTGWERIDAEDIEFHRRVREGYLTLVKDDDSRRWMKIDASKTEDEIFTEIQGITMARLGEAGIEPKRELMPLSLERMG